MKGSKYFRFKPSRFIEQPAAVVPYPFPEAIWRIKRKKRRTVYLTFDDGPIRRLLHGFLTCSTTMA